MLNQPNASVSREEESESVYLCQVGDRVSCGACCGLYNVANLSQNRLETLLYERTEKFSSVPLTVDGIDSFRQAIEGWTSEDRPFRQFYHCPYLGLIGKNRERVGCLLHPAATGKEGLDWRGLSYYGGLACRTYFCPSNRLLPEAWQKTLRQSMDHWYPYGLIVTERHLLTAFFVELEKRIGRPVSASDFAPPSKAAALFREFAGLKSTWPYRRLRAPGACNYFFENGQYPRPPVHRSDAGIRMSPYETILKELDSGFASADDLYAAESLLDRLFSQLTEAVAR